MSDIFYYNENGPKLYFYDKEFESFDWSKEPVETLEQLYKERAQQIRDSYERVVLCYSGGIDSTTVLETFYYNGIHIDEIVTVGALSQDRYSGSNENHNGDLYHNVFPTLNSLHLPNTKVSVIDYTKFFREPEQFTLVEKYGPEFMAHLGSRTSVHNLFYYDLDKFLPSSKKTAYVFGKDKPNIFKDNEGYYCCFYDGSFMDYGNRYNYENGERVNFYTDPKCFKILLKQLHMLKARGIHLENRFCDYETKVKNVIYNLRNPLTFQSEKSKIRFLSERDKFLLQRTNSDIFELYRKGLQFLGTVTDLHAPRAVTSRKWRL